MNSLLPLILPFVIFTLTGASQVTLDQWGTPGETSDETEQPHASSRLRSWTTGHRGIPLVELKTTHEVSIIPTTTGLLHFMNPG